MCFLAVVHQSALWKQSFFSFFTWRFVAEQLIVTCHGQLRFSPYVLKSRRFLCCCYLLQCVNIKLALETPSQLTLLYLRSDLSKIKIIPFQNHSIVFLTLACRQFGFICEGCDVCLEFSLWSSVKSDLFLSVCICMYVSTEYVIERNHWVIIPRNSSFLKEQNGKTS